MQLTAREIELYNTDSAFQRQRPSAAT
jgi:hypothetical protein